VKKINHRTFLIECYENGNRQCVEERRNKGFAPYELLGLLERIQMEIINQLENHLQKPDIKKIYAGGKKINNKMTERDVKP
jgi:hypothetical protein